MTDRNGSFPKVCPLINHSKVFCEQENRLDGTPLKKGKEDFCFTLHEESYADVCPMYSSWWHRTKMKTEISQQRREQDRRKTEIVIDVNDNGKQIYP